MDDLTAMKFTRSHEWALRKADTIIVGITDFAQHKLSDITGVELPEPDEHHYEAHEEMCVIESLKTAADCRAPVPGVITAINMSLMTRPELVNNDPYGQGWLVEMRPDNMADIDDLMDADRYEVMLPDEDEEDGE